MLLTIGHAAQQYAEIRNIIHKVDSFEYQLCRDYYSALRKIESMVPSRSFNIEKSFDRQFSFRDFGFNRVNCLHLFNAVSYSRTPWVVTFETFLPRFREVLVNHNRNPEFLQFSSKTRKALECLASDHCLGLFALSKSALELQEQLLDLFPDLRGTILGKTEVLHPPQDAATHDTVQLVYPFEQGNELRFMLVGHHFFRKGGMEVLRALDSVRQTTGASLKLCLVSALRSDQYAARADEEDIEWARQFIKANGDWIEHYSSLPHSEVVEKMTQCDVGLLPSYAETYGYSVLELQSRGRPVITTNVRAFPEINSSECGWLLPVPKREVGGEAFFRSVDERKGLSEAIEQGLIRVLEEIVGNPAQIREKGERALQRILDHHDPEVFGKKLESVYRKAL